MEEKDLKALFIKIGKSNQYRPKEELDKISLKRGAKRFIRNFGLSHSPIQYLTFYFNGERKSIVRKKQKVLDVIISSGLADNTNSANEVFEFIKGKEFTYYASDNDAIQESFELREVTSSKGDIRYDLFLREKMPGGVI